MGIQGEDMKPEDFIEDIPLSAAIAAHRGTSHVPEERGEQERRGYASTLAHDFEALSAYAETDEELATLEREFARYRAGYRSHFLVYLDARSRCMSTMIAGPSRFPTAKNAKRNDTADKRGQELTDYRLRVLDAIRKELQPELRPVMAGDSDAVERLREKLAERERDQERMRVANAAIRKHKRAGADAQVAALVKLGIHERTARTLLAPDFCGRVGFADYQLKNNGSEIRRLQARLAGLERDKAASAVELEGERARLEDCPADNRVRLFFPGKPDGETRARLKHSGFRWSPSLGCWQAYRNHGAIDVAKREAGVST